MDHDPPSKEDALPAAFMVYTDIQKLRGLGQPTDYGSGIEYANGLQFPESHGHKRNSQPRGLQIGLWLGGSQGCLDMVEGQLDDQLQRLFAYLSSATTPFDPIFLRVGYEFDNPQFGYSQDPALYCRAFRYLVDGYRRFVTPPKQQQHHHDIAPQKVLFVWHSWAAGVPEGQTLQDYYPGNDYVDWIGISIFQQLYVDAPSWGGNLETVQQVLDFAASQRTNSTSGGPSLPIMIAESTPFRGITELRDPWQDWFQPILQLIDNPANHIGLWSYINCDWDSQPMWHNVGFGQTRLAYNRTILKLWYEAVVQKPRFLSNVDCGGGLSQEDEQAPTGFFSRMRLDSMVPGVGLERFRHQPSTQPHHPYGMGNDVVWYGTFLMILIIACFRCSFWSNETRVGHHYQRCYLRQQQEIHNSFGGKRKGNSMMHVLSFIEEGDEEEELESSNQGFSQHDETGSLLQEQREGYGSVVY